MKSKSNSAGFNKKARVTNKKQVTTVRSVAGTVRVSESAPDLETADAAMREFFSAALNRR